MIGLSLQLIDKSLISKVSQNWANGQSWLDLNGPKSSKLISQDSL